MVLGLAASIAISASALANGFPNKPVTYVIPFGDGGESTVAARLQQSSFKRITGQDLVIVNKPGGGGAVVWSELNNMQSDGHLITGVNLPHIIVQPAYGASYKTSDVAAVHIFHYTPSAIFVSDDSPIDSLKDLIDAARERGDGFRVSGSGRGSANHLAQARFDKLADTKTKYEAFKGTAASVAALLQNQVEAAMAYSTVAVKYKSDVRMLAIATEKRHEEFPNVPTFKELGFDLVDGAYRGIAVPRGTPEPVRRTLSEIFSKIGQDEVHRKNQSAAGFVPLDIGYEKIPAFLAAQRKQYLETAQDAGLIKPKRQKQIKAKTLSN